LWALSIVQYSLLVREVRFGAIAKAGISSTFVGGVAGVAAAVMGAGVWAIALQLLVTVAVNTLVLWFVSGWRPAASMRPRSTSEMFRYGRWVVLSAALEVLYTQGFAALIGKLYGVRELGLFSRAQNVQQLPSGSIAAIIGRVAFSLFSRRADEPEAIGRAVRMANRAAMLVNAPMMVGLALLAEPALLVLFGPQWTPAAPVLTVLAFAGFLLPISAINLQVLLATGRSDSFFRVEIGKKLVGIAFVAIGSFFGIMGLAWAQLIFSVVALAMNLHTVAQVTSYTLMPQVRDLADILLPLAIMTAVVLVIEAILTGSPFVMVAVAVLAGALAYGLTGLGLRLPSFMEGLDLLPPRLRRLVPWISS
ncbi:MAG: hypothetical protein QOI38_951, partial [Sphingomonadales bacterium]|nr:hypothetical protein [Sphingomonadales bacterium]